MKKFLSATSLFITLLVLMAIMIALQQFEYETTTDSVFNPKSLAATGFIILAAFTMGEFFKSIKIPALLGYIAAGILFGPNLAPLISPDAPALFSISVIDDLALINVLTVGVIGTMGGGELQIQDIKGNIKTIFLVITLLFILAVPATMGSVILMAEYTPSLVPFLEGTSKESVIAAALLMGVFALAMSPAATLAILQESKAKGKFTSLVLGIVVVADIALVLTFLLAFSFDKLLLAPGGFKMEALIEALPGIGAEFGYALLIGIITGVIYILYMRFVARELMFFTVAVIFAASYASTLLHAETLMAFLTAGFIVQNFSKHGHDMIHSLEKISLPVFVIYFMTQAAQLDLQAVYGFLGVTAVLTVIRALAFYSGTKIATQWSGAKENVKRYLWLCFFSRGGVDLVLGAMVAGALTPWGQDFQTVIMAVVVVHIVAGPPLLKLGLDWAGETESARVGSAEQGAGFAPIPSVSSADDLAFPMPQLGDRHLQPRMLQLREFLTNLHTTHIAKKFEAQSNKLRKLISRLETSTNYSLTAMRDILERDDFEASYTGNAERAKEIRKVRTRFHQSISGLIKELYTTKTTVIDEFAVSDILRQIRQEESFGSAYRIPNNDYYFQTNDTDRTWIRVLKWIRRLNRAITGSSGYRRIPFGRLWRFYVELEVPRALCNAASESGERNQILWYTLGQHIRDIDKTFVEVMALLNAEITPQEVAKGHKSDDTDTTESAELHRDDSHTDAGASQTDGSVDTPTSEECSTPSLTPLNHAIDALNTHEAAIAKLREETLRAIGNWESTSITFYTLSLKKPFSDLLGATYKSGTLELPSFLYRPSLRFDSSRMAEKSLHNTILEEEDITEGQKGWIVTDEQSLNFGFWFDVFNGRLSDKLDTSINSPVQVKLDDLEKFCRLLPPAYRDYTKRIQEVEDELAQQREKSLEEPPKHTSGNISLDPPTDPNPVDDIPIPIIDWEDWYNNQIKPQLDRTRNTLEFLRQTYNDASPMSKHGRTLEVRIERFASSLLLLTQGPNDPEPTNDVVRFSPQEWYVQELETAVKLRLSEVNERVRAILQLSINAMDDFEQFTALNLTTPASAAEHAMEGDSKELQRVNANAANVTQRAAKMANELAKSQAKRVAELRRWLQNQLHKLYQASARPIAERDTRRLSRKSLRVTELSRRRSALPGVFKNLSPKKESRRGPLFVPVHARLRSQLFHLMYETRTDVTLNDVRNFLRPTSSTLVRRRCSVPDIYRRLFTPGPLNINGFYIARHVSHNELLTAIDTWRYTPLKSTILLHSDRGFGKASLIRHVLNVPSLESFPKVSVRLREDLTSIDDFVHDLLNAFTDDSNATSLDTTAVRTVETQLSFIPDVNHDINSYRDVESALRAIRRASEHPIIIVIENAHKLFSRTEKGLHLCQQFLTLMNETKNNVLWITLFNSSAVQWLETSIELRSYFTHTIRLNPFSKNEIRRLIKRRHPISGFSHTIIPEATNAFDWLFHPLKTFKNSRHPHQQFYTELARLSKGSPLLALTNFLDCVELDPHDDSNILVHHPRRREIDLTAPLTLNKQLILATLIQHGSMTLKLLSEVMQQPEKRLYTELQQLKSLGFIELIAGTKSECYRMQAYAEALVILQLRRRNIL